MVRPRPWRNPLSLRSWIAVVAVLLAAGCGAERQEAKLEQASSAVPGAGTPTQETFALGTALTRAGAVSREATADSFLRGGEVFLSVNLNGATAEQEVEVRWVASDGAVLQTHSRSAPAGATYLAFSSGPTQSWPAGDHRAVVVIDGRAVSEKPFRLIAQQASTRSNTNEGPDPDQGS